MARRAACVLWSALIAAVVGVPIAWALLQRPANILDTEIVAGAPDRQPDSVDLGVTYLADGSKRAQVGLWQANPQRIASHAEIRLLFVAYDATPTLIRGELHVRGTGCFYETQPGAAIVHNGPLVFVRQPGCAGMPTDQVEPRLDLSVTFRGRGHLGLLTYVVPRVASDPAWITCSDPASAIDTLQAVRGRYVDYPSVPARQRIELLAYAWQLSGLVTWIWALVGLALLLLFIAGVLLTSGPPGEAWTGTLRCVAGVGLFALGLAVLYVVLMPPLQAADEPDHLLDVAQLAGRPDLAGEAATLARIGHFDRIRFHGDEHLRSVDVGHPLAKAWGTEVFALDVAARSATTSFWWKVIALLVQPTTAAGVLLAARLANALLFAVSLSLATWLLRATCRDSSPAPHAVALALLLVPTLPFFASGLSEFAVLTSCYVVLAVLVAALFLDGRRTHLLGVPLGLAMTLVLLGGRSGLPLVPVFGALMVARALLGSSQDGPAGDGTKRTVVFWAGLALGLAWFPLLSGQTFRTGLWPGDASAVPGRFKAVADVVRIHPWLAVVVAPVGLPIELATAWVRRRLGAPGRVLSASARVLCYGAAAAIAGCLILSWKFSYPSLGLLEGAPPGSAQAYALRAAEVALSGARLGNHDLLLSLSFWEGFGWVDTLPGDGFVSLLVVLSSLAAIGVLVRVARAGRIRRVVWLGVVAGGWLAALVLYAVSSYYLHRNLHGRYLLGLYLSILAVCATSVALLAPVSRFAWTRRLGISREWWLAAAAAGIHAWALRFILLRYF